MKQLLLTAMRRWNNAAQVQSDSAPKKYCFEKGLEQVIEKCLVPIATGTA